MMKAENYLNVGYQRLLTFERPGGGFDWWGSGRAARLAQRLWSARVQRHVQGLSDRPRHHRPHPELPLKQMDKDGTWSEHRRHPQRNHRQHGQRQVAADQLRRLVAARQRPAKEPAQRSRSTTSATTSRTWTTTPTSWPWPPTPWPPTTPRTTAPWRPAEARQAAQGRAGVEGHQLPGQHDVDDLCSRRPRDRRDRRP